METPARKTPKAVSTVAAQRRTSAAAPAPTPVRPTVKVRTAVVTRYPALAGPDAPAWELVQRIASSRRFGRSALLTHFLLFVTHRSLTGRAAEINEQQIGVHVFGRDERFNRSDDNIVRTYARMLRKRLEDYFRTEGRDELLTVAIPRGSYVPLFTERTALPAEPAAEILPPHQPEPDQPATAASASTGAVAPIALARISPPPRPILPRLSPALAGSALLLALCLALAHLSLAQWLRAQTPTGRLNHRLWSQIFEPNRDTYLVPADGGLVMLQSFLPRHVNLTDYASGNYRSPDTIRQGLLALAGSQPGTVAVPLPAADLPSLVHKVEVLGVRRYTSVVDLELTSQLSRLPEVVPQRLMIRYARDLRMDDLRTGNLVLLGSADSNPWAEIFQPLLNFQFTFGAAYGGSPIILNRHPLPGERATYGSEDSDTAHRSYGVIAYLPNLGATGDTGTSTGEGSGHVLLVEGVNMAGTEAAGSFLLSPELMRPVLERAMGPNGVLRPFEVLLDTSNIAANSARPQVLSERILPN